MTCEMSDSISHSAEHKAISVSLPEIVRGLVEEEGEKAVAIRATGPVPETIFQEPRFFEVSKKATVI